MTTIFVLWLLSANGWDQPKILNDYPLAEACERAKQIVLNEGHQAVCKESKGS